MLKTVSTQLALASDTLPEVLAKGNTTGGTDLAVSTGDDITLADNSKVIFGAGSDLQIYSNGASGQVTGNISVSGNVGVGSSALASTEIRAYKNDDDTGNANIRIEQNGTGDAYMSYLLSGVQWWSHGIDNSDNNNWVLASNNDLIDNRHLVITTAGAATFASTVASAGVYLGGTAAANLLDDYEEGTFVPVGFGITFTTAEGRYTKIGDTVIWSVNLVFPTTADTNVTRVTLPFVVGSGNDNRGNATIGLNGGGVAGLTALHAGGVNRANLYINGVIGTNADFSTDNIMLGGSYKV